MRRDYDTIVSPELGTGFVSSSIDTILNLEPGDERYTWQITQAEYRDLLERMREMLKQI